MYYLRVAVNDVFVLKIINVLNKINVVEIWRIVFLDIYVVYGLQLYCKRKESEGRG